MSERSGYVKLFRKVKGWEWYKDVSVKVLFFHILLTVEPDDTYIQGVYVQAGSLKKTINELAIESGLTTQQTRRAINELKKTNEITIKTTNKFSVITLVKWLDYQDSNVYKNNLNNKPNNKRKNKQNDVLEQTNNTTNTQTNSYIYNDSIIKDKDNTIQEEKKIRSVFEIYANADVDLLNALKDYEDMRKSIKSPMTDRAKTLLCTELDKLKADGQNIIECVNKAIVNNWKSVYAINNQNKVKPNGKQNEVYAGWGRNASTSRVEPIPDYNVSKSEMSKDELDNLKVRLSKLSKTFD